jgi:1,4-dihydroxy-2-naphthoate octaprenyltransferase
VVLTEVPRWLASARRNGAFETRTVFVRRDGTPFAAEIRITPTYRGERQIGYCGVTTPRPDLQPAEAMPRTGLRGELLRWLVILRLPFLTASLSAVLVGAAYAPARDPWILGLCFLGMAAIHAAANALNDHFDWASGTDPANTEYFTPFSGGSRAIELGLISSAGMLRTGLVALAVSAAAGLSLAALGRPWVLAFGLAGALSAWFYTAPPLRLVARRGWGEWLIGLNFGVLPVAGTAYALTGRLAPADFLVGIPVGLLTTAILWINEFPDAASDAATGKNHLVVALGKRNARWGYAALLAGAFAVQAAIGPLLPLLALPLAAHAVWILWRSYESRDLARGCAATIRLQLIFALLNAAGLFRA